MIRTDEYSQLSLCQGTPDKKKKTAEHMNQARRKKFQTGDPLAEWVENSWGVGRKFPSEIHGKPRLRSL